MVISSGLAHGSEAEGCASGLANETNADGEQGIAQRSREWQESGTDRADYTGLAAILDVTLRERPNEAGVA